MDIVVVGIGRIGLVASCCLVNSGHRVTGVDINKARLESLAAGIGPVSEKGLEQMLRQGLASGRLTFSPIMPARLNCQVLMIAVNTPLSAGGSIDLSQVHAVADQIQKVAQGPLIVVMKSTVTPGTGLDLIQRYFKKVPITYVSNPEFLRTGRGVYDWYHPSRIVVGANDENSAKEILSMYSDIKGPIMVTDITSAEMIKGASNAFLATKISFINEIANICEAVGANVDDVSKGMGLDSRIGSGFLQAGLGYGGSCLPKDAKALNYLASSKDYSFKLLSSTIEVNARQRTLIVQKLKSSLGSLRGKRIAILGLAFKPDTDDIIEAPSLDIIKLLLAEGAKLQVYDPVAMDYAKSLFPDSVVFASDVYSATAGVCSIILATEWKEFINADWKAIKREMIEPYVILDGRNALPKDELIATGFQYKGVGRLS